MAMTPYTPKTENFSAENSELVAKIEALLFLQAKAMSVIKLTRVCGASAGEIDQAINSLQKSYEERGSGLAIIKGGTNVQMTTSAAASDFVKKYLHDETTGELTRPSLETLTIVAYRGPVAKSEIELIRGVNCSLILRNLLIRGLVEEVGETETGSPQYQVTSEFLRYLGINKVADLPNYIEFNQNIHLQELLKAQQEDFFKSGAKHDDSVPASSMST